MGDRWIGVDLDGTLAHYDGWDGSGEIGAPILRMRDRVLDWLAQGITVKIFTARANHPSMVPAIRRWCLEHLGEELEVTATKDFDMGELWDDRAVRVEANTGRRIL